MSRPRLVLVGPGLANLQALARLGERAEVTLVSEGDHHTYSGMLPGVLVGQRDAEAASIDLAALCARSGARLEPSGAQRLDLEGRIVELRDGRRVPFDVLSVNIGAGQRGDGLPGVRQHAISLKPMFPASHLLLAAEGPLVIAGGGVAAVELALVLKHRTKAPTTLVTSADVLPRAGPALAAAALRELEQAGVTVLTQRRVVGAEPNTALLDDGSRLAFGTLVWATGPKAAAILRGSSAAVDEAGYLRVASTLQSTSHPAVFGAGDCVSIDHHEGLEKAGVFSIRQGPTLVENLTAALAGRPPSQRYEPTLRPLQLLNLGDGRALGTWHGHVFSGRAAFWLKEFIDRRWIRQYRAVERR